jgi:hypothetical protein
VDGPEREGTHRGSAFADAVVTVKAITDERTRGALLNEIAMKAHLMNSLDSKAELIAELRAIPTLTLRVKGLSAIVGCCDPLLRKELARELLQLIGTLDDGELLTTVVGNISEVISDADSQLLEQSTRTIEALSSVTWRAQALFTLAVARKGQPDGNTLLRRARDEARIAGYPHQLSELIGDLEGDERRSALQLALRAALDSGSTSTRIQALVSIGCALEGRERSRVFDQALQSARSIPDGSERVSSLAMLVMKAQGRDRFRVAVYALREIRSIPTRSLRAQALSAVSRGMSTGLLAGSLDEAVALHDLEAIVPFFRRVAPVWNDLCRMRRVSPISEIYDLIATLSSVSRPQFLRLIGALTEAIDTVGGPSCVDETIHSISDAAACWQ